MTNGVNRTEFEQVINVFVDVLSHFLSDPEVSADHIKEVLKFMYTPWPITEEPIELLKALGRVSV